MLRPSWILTNEAGNANFDERRVEQASSLL